MHVRGIPVCASHRQILAALEDRPETALLCGTKVMPTRGWAHRPMRLPVTPRLTLPLLACWQAVPGNYTMRVTSPLALQGGSRRAMRLPCGAVLHGCLLPPPSQNVSPAPSADLPPADVIVNVSTGCRGDTAARAPARTALRYLCALRPSPAVVRYADACTACPLWPEPHHHHHPHPQVRPCIRGEVTSQAGDQCFPCDPGTFSLDPTLLQVGAGWGKGAGSRGCGR